MSRKQAVQAPTLAVGALPPALPEPSDLAVAVRVAQTLFADYGDSRRDGFSYPEAYGALREALRLVLRATGAEPPRTPVAELHRLCRDDYASSADRRNQDRRDDAQLTENGAESVAARVELPARCPAAHGDDPTPCSGPPTVTILDATNAGARGCEHHGARLLASLDGGRVYGLPDAAPGTAIRVFKAAQGIRPFPWVDGPRTRDDQLSRDEVRARGEAK
jgi:hypothetical protein